ncbi:MAG: cytochrome c3 family protein [Pirellulaceae bacterium]
MRHTSITMVLATGIVMAAMMLAAGNSRMHLPDNQQGYAPEQPIAFSHQLHAGEMAISCRYCHYAAEQGRHAGIPSAGVCLNCHRFVPATFGAIRAEDELAKEEGREIRPVVSDEIRKIYDSLALDVENKLAPKEGSSPKPIEWVRVHNLPSFVYFDHRAHVVAGVKCQHCHGPVKTMQRIRQVESLGMGWCVNCHRDANEHGVQGAKVHASTDCDACHH